LICLRYFYLQLDTNHSTQSLPCSVPHTPCGKHSKIT